jgi:hypothetical protein
MIQQGKKAINSEINYMEPMYKDIKLADSAGNP